MHALMAGLGSRNVSLKGDAEEGNVELTIDGETYTRTLTRTEEGVRFGGDPYLDDSESADLFAFLLESNPARQAVERGDDLHDLILRPVDTESIEANIRRLARERDSIDDKLESVAAARDRMSTLTHRRDEINDEITSAEEDLEAAREALASAKANADDAGEDEERESVEDAVARTRSELESVRDRLETQRESLTSVQNEYDSIGMPDESDVAKIEHVESEIERLRKQKRSYDTTVNRLQTLIQVTQHLVSDEQTRLFEVLNQAALGNGDNESKEEDTPVTAELLPNEKQTVQCWTCGSEVERGEIEASVNRLREGLEEARSERESIDHEISDFQGKLSEYREVRRERERLHERRERLREEIEERNETIASLETREVELEETLERLESKATSLESSVQEAVLERQREVAELDVELERLRENRTAVEEELDAARVEVDREADLQERREEITEALTEQRDRIETIESTAVSEFNEHMAALLNLLEYANLERVWIERSGNDDTEFVLHIVRNTADGVAYEDTIDHLSESERKVTGLVFGLAGYLVHDIYDTVPVMLLDSLEAIDSERIAKLVEYFESYVPSIIVALLPEDAQALNDRYERIRDV